jgi:starch synthase
MYNTKKFDDIRKTIQQIDHSLDKEAEEYIEVYQSLKK